MAQNFYIRKKSTLPVLKMKVVNDGRYDYRKIFDRLESANITFSMIDEKGKHRVYNKTGLLIPVDKEVCKENQEFYIGYKFTEKDTKKVGVYKAQFKIDFTDDNSTLIVPIEEDLYITVSDSFTKSNF